MKKKIEDWRKIDYQVVQILKNDYLKFMDVMNHAQIEVNQKTSKRDLVTNIDFANQKFLIQELLKILPDSKIIAEEHEITNKIDGLVWIIDPLDGTMNFVEQKQDFAVMVSLYEDGRPRLGYILDVMNHRLLHGGVAVNQVYLNSKPLSAPKNTELADGLIGLSGPMLVNDDYHFQTIEKNSLGTRVIGSAGIEFMRVIMGFQVGYISHLKVWDFAAGNVIANQLGLNVSYIDGSPINMLKSGVVLVATKKAYNAIREIVE